MQKARVIESNGLHPDGSGVHFKASPADVITWGWEDRPSRKDSWFMQGRAAADSECYGFRDFVMTVTRRHGPTDPITITLNMWRLGALNTLPEGAAPLEVQGFDTFQDAMDFGDEWARYLGLYNTPYDHDLFLDHMSAWTRDRRLNRECEAEGLVVCTRPALKSEG